MEPENSCEGGDGDGTWSGPVRTQKQGYVQTLRALGHSDVSSSVTSPEMSSLINISKMVTPFFYSLFPYPALFFILALIPATIIFLFVHCLCPPIKYKLQERELYLFCSLPLLQCLAWNKLI